MKFEFTRVTRTIRLGDFAEEMGDQTIRVWVNMTRANIERINEVKINDAKIVDWLSEVWGPYATIEEIRGLYDYCVTQDLDPGLWLWLVRETLRLIYDYRAGVKKA